MTMNLKCINEWERFLPRPDELTPLSQKLIPHELACAFNLLPSSSSSACAVPTASSDVPNASHSTHWAFKSFLQIRSVPLPSAESERKNGAEEILALDQGKVDDYREPQSIIQAVKEGGEHGLPGLHRSQAGRVGSALVTEQVVPYSAACDYLIVSSLAPEIATVLSQPMSASFTQKSAYFHIPESSTADLSHGKALLGDTGAGIGGSILENAKNPVQLMVDPRNENALALSMDFFQSSSVAMSNEEQLARTLKKPRLVWTPQLHKRFVDAVAHLGIKHAVPKTIMQLMNVDGLTRENVASHLQKYRLYLKRVQGFSVQGFSNEGPSSSDQLFESTPVPPSLAASAHLLVAHHSQHRDQSYGPVQNANLPRILGHPAHISSPTMSFSGFYPRPSFSTLQRAPPPVRPLIDSELGRESYMPQTSSAPGQVLSLFPNNRK